MARLTDPSAPERPSAQAPRDLHLVRAENVAPSGAIGAGLTHLGSDIEQGADQVYRAQKIEEDRINTIGAEDALNKLRDKALDLSIGPENGYTQVKGSEAVNRPVLQDWTKKLDEARSEISQGLPNDAQRAKFTPRADLTSMQFKEGILRHLAQQSDVFAAESFGNTIKMERQMASTQWNSPNDVGVSIERVKNATYDLAHHQGKSPEWTAATLRSATSEIHSGVVEGALASNNYDYANQWIEANKDQIEPQDLLKLRREIKTVAMPVQARQDAMTIMKGDTTPDGAELTATQTRARVGDWLKQADDIAAKKYPNDPIYRDMVVNQISTYVSRIATAQQAQERNARNDVLTTAITPGPNGEKVSDLNSLLSTPGMKDNWKMMEPEQQLGILHVLEHNAKGNDPPETLDALNLYHEMRGLAVNDPEAFQTSMRDDFKELGTKLPRHLFLQLIAQDTSIDKADAKAASVNASLAQIRSLDKLYEQGTQLPLPKGKDEKRKDVQDAYQAWTSRVLDGIQDFQDQNKRKPNLIELREIGKQLLTQGYESGTGHTWFGYTFGQKKTFAFQQNDIGNFAVPAPPEDAKQITDAFVKTFGREPTRQEIDQWYTAGKMKK